MVGSVAVALGSVTFIAASGGSPPSPLQKKSLDAPGATGVSTSTSPNSPTTTIRHNGQVTSSSSGNGVAHGVPLGVYAGEGDPAGIARFASATGTHPTFADEYLAAGQGWAAMDNAANVNAWIHSPYRLVLGVPILPGVGSYAQGATGAYNRYFTVLADKLVSDHEANAILRLGWEFNGNWFYWAVRNANDAANFASYWRQIVTTMRAVPGEKFTFLWNPDAGGAFGSAYTPDQAYPGDAYVDYVGIDIYDNFWGTPFTPPVGWADHLSQQWGLDWLASFSAQTNKPIAIPEWSDEYRPDHHGFGDDPAFIDNIADWFTINDVAFTCIWSYDSSTAYRNNLLDGTFPKALAAFKRDFG